jgi:hypothetical protein
MNHHPLACKNILLKSNDEGIISAKIDDRDNIVRFIDQIEKVEEEEGREEENELLIYKELQTNLFTYSELMKSVNSIYG